MLIIGSPPKRADGMICSGADLSRWVNPETLPVPIIESSVGSRAARSSLVRVGSSGISDCAMLPEISKALSKALPSVKPPPKASVLGSLSNDPARPNKDAVVRPAACRAAAWD